MQLFAMGLKFIKVNKKKNFNHLIVLVTLIIALSSLGSTRGEEYIPTVDVESEQGLTITIGGSYNPPVYYNQQGISFDPRIIQQFSLSDFGILSMVAPIGDHKELGQKIPLIDPSVEMFLSESMIDVVQLSDHRSLDVGVTGLMSTLDFLSKNEIGQVGLGLNKEEALRPAYYTVNDLTVAVVALNANPPAGWAAGNHRFGVASANDDMLAETLMTARGKSDLMIVLVSFTNEQGASEQRALAKSLVDQGAQLVVGTGTGPMQRVEPYQQGLIFYNIGHLTSPPAMFSYEKESILLNVTLHTTGEATVTATPLFVDHIHSEVVTGNLHAFKISKRLGAMSWRLDI